MSQMSNDVWVIICILIVCAMYLDYANKKAVKP